METKRGQFVTKIGVVAATVGSAVGLGNIWRFPYEAGSNGGGAFMVIYLACVFILGIPVMIAEFVIGRGTHSNPKRALKSLSKNGKFHWVAYGGIVASIMILSFYSVVAGWIVEYLVQAISGGLTGHTPEEFSLIFNEFTASPVRSVAWTLLFLLLNFLVLRRGVERGIERVSNILMPILFLLLIIFCINSLSLPGAARGMDFLFNPDFSKLTPSVVLGAMGQAFFSLSLGLTCLLTYASYFSDSTRLVRSATIIAILDTAVAVLAGIIIFPAVFSFNVEPTAGPTLVFETLPSVFQQMPCGYFWAVAFFALLFFASLTSTISMSEISISFFQEEWSLSRTKATGLNTIAAMFFGTLCALSFGVLSHLTIFGMTFFDLFDFVSSNILLPIGGMTLSLFVGWWVDRRFVDQQLTNNGALRVSMVAPIRFCMRFVAPICIALVFLYGLGCF